MTYHSGNPAGRGEEKYSWNLLVNNTVAYCICETSCVIAKVDAYIRFNSEIMSDADKDLSWHLTLPDSNFIFRFC